ncbi:hypothetical protein DY000_02017476 [Brassica cretica]|uniref:PB1 domain-containing protein n=1 Tax=Brassica cretica TaxID=69181 RepID=A0ABQ7D5J8_BRACR|nr:hypothetical protein DY000_02017476 [Brassica cretica]
MQYTVSRELPHHRVFMTLFRSQDQVTEIAYGHPTTFRRNSDGCKAVRRNTVGIFQSQTAIKRSYIFVGNGHMVRRKFVGKFRRNTDDGNDRVTATATIPKEVPTNEVGGETNVIDEIKRYFDCRSITVQRLAVHLPGEHHVTYESDDDFDDILAKEENQTSQLLEWMKMNERDEEAK